VVLCTHDSLEAAEEADCLHRDRYQVAERIYLAEVNPRALASIIIDNSDLRRPRIVATRGP
jgi:uridine kinase